MPFFHHLPPDFSPWGFPREAFLRRNGRACSSRTGRAGGLLKFQLIEKSSSDQVAVDLLEQQVSADLEALLEEESATEGGKKARLIAYFERNPALRTAAIAIHGTTCKVCGFNFEAAYGEHGKNYIEVHHVIPISTLPEPSSINPREDLTVLCSNCHRMIHRKREAPLSIEELRNVLSSSGASDA